MKEEQSSLQLELERRVTRNCGDFGEKRRREDIPMAAPICHLAYEKRTYCGVRHHPVNHIPKFFLTLCGSPCMKISPYPISNILIMGKSPKKKKYYPIEPSPMKNSSSSDCRIANSTHNFTGQTFLMNLNSSRLTRYTL